METQKQLAEWLIVECNKRNLSWAEASRRAGVAANTISQVVNGTPAGPKRLTALADYFNAPHAFVFQLAGLLSNPADEDYDPLVERYAGELIDIWRQLRELDPEAAQRLMNIGIMQGEMVLLAAQAAKSKEDNTNRPSEEQGSSSREGAAK